MPRQAALQLRQVVALARHAAATDIRLEKAGSGEDIAFIVARGETVLARGTLPARLEKAA